MKFERDPPGLDYKLERNLTIEPEASQRICKRHVIDFNKSIYL
jgi:hypothetical protein